MAASTATTGVDPLVVRGVALGLYGRLLGDDPAPLASGTGVDELREALSLLDEHDALMALDRLEAMGRFSETEVTTRRVRLFERGKCPPYELSHVPPGAASHTGVLADIAAFYSAYLTKVAGDRPDHCVAELEFLAMVTLAEASCQLKGDLDGARLNAQTARTFLRDHLGSWLGLLGAKLDLVDPDGPYGPIVDSAACFVASEAKRRQVIPIRPAGLLPDWEDDESEIPVCGGPGAI
jgi:nitrate reductase assembly molybdenum cofactor insertion protein NarJ